MHWNPVCEITPTLAYLATASDAEGDNLIHSFTASATENKWCEGVAGTVHVVSELSEAGYHSDSVGTDSQTVKVTQNSHFDAETFTATVAYTATEGTSAEATADFNFDIFDYNYCQYSLTTEFEFESDTIHKVNLKQTHSGSFSKLCGTCERSLTHGEDSVDVTAAAPTTKWTVDSVTGDISVGAEAQCKFVSSGFKVSATEPWTQGCKVEVLNSSIVKFTEANYDLGTQANAEILLQAATVGDCGSSYTFQATLSED